MELGSLEGVGVKEGKYVSIMVKRAIAGNLIEYTAELKDGGIEHVLALIGSHMVDLSPFFEDREVGESLLTFLQLVYIRQADAKAEEVCV